MDTDHVPESGATAPFDRRANMEALVQDFDLHVRRFEESRQTPGPGLYFHERAIERRRQHASARSLLKDQCFLEYVYAVLPAWGMHRMGRQATKVNDFDLIVDALRAAAPSVEELWPLRVTDLTPQQAAKAGALAWQIIAAIRVSTSRTQIVAGSKTLHHILPDLIPPIDRRYTFRFFTGRTRVPDDGRAFREWFPELAEIGRRCGGPIEDAVRRGGFMATGPAKVIDNAIIGYFGPAEPASSPNAATSVQAA